MPITEYVSFLAPLSSEDFTRGFAIPAVKRSTSIQLAMLKIKINSRQISVIKLGVVCSRLRRGNIITINSIWLRKGLISGSIIHAAALISGFEVPSVCPQFECPPFLFILSAS